MSLPADDDLHQIVPQSNSDLSSTPTENGFSEETDAHCPKSENPSLQAIDRLLRHVYRKEPNSSDESNSRTLGWLEQLLIAELPDRFSVLERLGGGTFGVVFRAQDNRLEREIALKVLRPDWMQNATHLSRFLRESRVASGLNHTHIVRVLEAGESEKVAWQVMDIVDGDSFDNHIHYGRIETKSTVRLVSQLADALAYAHELGIVHRDIKPANILINRDVGEDLSGAIALLTDFGLARISQEHSAHLSGSSGIVGTPQYMAPELLELGIQASGPQSDVYSLGVVLYEALTGENPFKHFQVWSDRYRQSWKMNAAFPLNLSGIPKDLFAICQKAMAQNPVDRYRTADVLAEDLRRYLRGSAVTARGLSSPERIWRQAKQNKVLSLLSCSLIVCLFSLLVVAVRNANSANQQNRKLTDINSRLAEAQRISQELAHAAQRHRDEAVAERKRFAALARDSSMANAYRTYENARIDESQQILNGLRASQPEVAETLEWKLLNAQIQSEFKKIPSFSTSIQEVRQIPNSNLIAVASGSRVKIVDVFTGETKCHFATSIPNIHAMAVHPTQPWMYLGGTTNSETDLASVIQLNWTNGNELKVVDSFATTVESIAISQDGRFLTAASRYDSPRCFDLTQNSKWSLPGTRRNTWLCYINAMDSVVYQSESGEIGIASQSKDDRMYKLDFEPILDNNHIVTATVVGNGPLVAVATSSHAIYLVNAEDGEVVGTLNGCKNVSVLTSNAVGNLVAAGTAGGEIALWHLPISPIIQNPTSIDDARSPAEKRIVRNDKERYSLGGIEEFRSWQLDASFVSSLIIVENLLACGTNSGDFVAITIDSMPIAELTQRPFQSESTQVWESCSCPDAGLVLLRDHERTVYKLSVSILNKSNPERYENDRPPEYRTRARRQDLTRYLTNETILDGRKTEDSIAGLAASSDGKRMAWPLNGFQLTSRNQLESKVLTRSSNLTSATASLRVLALSPDGSMVAVGTEKYWLSILSTDVDHHQIACFELPGKPYCAQWDGASRQVIVGGNFDRIIECDIDSGEMRSISDVHTSISALTLSPSKSKVLSGHVDGTLRVTERDTGMSECILAHDTKINSIVLDRNERFGLSADFDGNLVAWNLANNHRLGTIWRATPYNRSALQVLPSLLLSPDESEIWLVSQGPRGPAVRSLILE